ncbi:hypothetical protein NQ315_012358 [Exocentrus adspersus]|uniref:Uncharacterized protein n=1 Tax=Exocentrus adspersus TaxID=1586481 RepID=A0AAV8V4V9_9CUCU|nr:hypothetical protein NQ315_012358 [Exocentrus adspersus]
MSDSEDLPSDIEEAATSAVSTLLPSKSKDKYKKIYNRFTSWCEKKNLKNHLQEKVLLAYFSELSKSYSSSSLWAFYSMIRAVASMKNNIDIKEIARFLKEADDKKFLLTKVGLVIGIAGACRKQELTNLLNEKVKDEGSVFHIEITTTKTKISREFFITSGGFEGELEPCVQARHLKDKKANYVKTNMIGDTSIDITPATATDYRLITKVLEADKPYLSKAGLSAGQRVPHVEWRTQNTKAMWRSSADQSRQRWQPSVIGVRNSSTGRADERRNPKPKCGADHETGRCEKPREEPARCAHCSGPHPASYRGVPSIPTQKSYPKPAKKTRGCKQTRNHRWSADA